MKAKLFWSRAMRLVLAVVFVLTVAAPAAKAVMAQEVQPTLPWWETPHSPSVTVEAVPAFIRPELPAEFVDAWDRLPHEPPAAVEVVESVVYAPEAMADICWPWELCTKLYLPLQLQNFDPPAPCVHLEPTVWWENPEWNVTTEWYDAPDQIWGAALVGVPPSSLPVDLCIPIKGAQWLYTGAQWVLTRVAIPLSLVFLLSASTPQSWPTTTGIGFSVANATVAFTAASGAVYYFTDLAANQGLDGPFSYSLVPANGVWLDNWASFTIATDVAGEVRVGGQTTALIVYNNRITWGDAFHSPPAEAAFQTLDELTAWSTKHAESKEGIKSLVLSTSSSWLFQNLQDPRGSRGYVEIWGSSVPYIYHGQSFSAVCIYRVDGWLLYRTPWYVCLHHSWVSLSGGGTYDLTSWGWKASWILSDITGLNPGDEYLIPDVSRVLDSFGAGAAAFDALRAKWNLYTQLAAIKVPPYIP